MARSGEASGVARGVVSECWAPCLFYLGLGVQGHGLPSTPQSPTQLSQQALGIGQETGFRASEANSSGFRLNINTSSEEMRDHPGWELNAWRHTVCHTILQHLSLRSHAEKAFEGEKDSHACTYTRTHSHARAHGLCS